MGSQELPGEPLKQWQLFEIRKEQGRADEKIVGFKDPEGILYSLEKDEELIHITSANGKDRDTFIRRNGQDIPFETWKKSQPENPTNPRPEKK